MIFNNLIKERRDKKINTLPKEIQRKLKRFEELDSSDYQLQVIKPVMSCLKKGIYLFYHLKKDIIFWGKSWNQTLNQAIA